MTKEYEHLYNILIKTCKEYNLKTPTFKISNALKLDNGVCHIYKSYNTTSCKIVISGYILKLYSMKTAEETLYHEIAHYIDFEQTGYLGHSENFKKICMKLGGSMNEQLAGTTYSKTKTTDFVSRKLGYLYQCPCGYGKKETIRKVSEKTANKLYCPKCGTKLKDFNIIEKGRI